ncbi:threonine/serine dehydratase [Haloechinothrix salitolerans]|uniref:Threonine/serine dehydratase n=1 Tax=Haloechinothrix salitolerans TaxID=926830 RepID=A0ABW2C1Q4_9PSEU
MELVSSDDIDAAARRIKPYVLRTPLLHSERLSDELGCRVLVKAENLQHTGSFKPRGACNTLLSWRERGELPERVVTFSAGNHAAAVAFAGRQLGVTVTVSMPESAQQAKVDNVRRYGGEIVPTDDLRGTCDRLAREHDCPALYPFDLPEVIAGQGTVGREIREDVQPDLVLVPVGGGGLVGGIGTAVKAAAPDCRVVGVEPALSNAVGQALAANEVVRLPRGAPTMADGLAAPFAGEHTLAQVRRYVDDVVSVAESDIATAWPDMIAATRLMLEPSAVVGLAALRAGAVAVPDGGTVVLVASGGNAAPPRD